MGHAVSLENVTAELAHLCGDDALAAADSAREPDAKHQWTAPAASGRDDGARAFLAPCSPRMAMVKGPTPPGTGVKAPATWTTSG